MKRLPAKVVARSGTAAEWESRNPTPLQGELCITVGDGGLFLGWKVGDGKAAWNDLGYINSGVTDHALLTDLDYAHANHTGFVADGDSRLSDARTPLAHAHAASDITSGSLDGDRLPAPTFSKKGAVPTLDLGGNRFLRSDGGWAVISESEVDHLSDDLAGKAPTSHAHAASDLTSGALDGDRLPALSQTKKGGVPATGSPSGKFLRDDGSWQSAGGGSVPTGTGFRHVTSGAEDSAAKLVENVDVKSDAAIAESKLNLNHATHDNANDPTSDQKAALGGTSGSPSSSNKYVTDDDARNSNARTPTAHNHTASEVTSGTLDGDRLPAISTSKLGGVPAAPTPSGKFLRDDATWQTPSASPAGIVPVGGIILWSGLIASIPANWALCDGNNGTPDLRDKFVVGAYQDSGGVAKSNIEGTLKQTGGATSHTHANHANLTHAGLSVADHASVALSHDGFTVGAHASTVLGHGGFTPGAHASTVLTHAAFTPSAHPAAALAHVGFTAADHLSTLFGHTGFTPSSHPSTALSHAGFTPSSHPSTVITHGVHASNCATSASGSKPLTGPVSHAALAHDGFAAYSHAALAHDGFASYSHGGGANRISHDGFAAYSHGDLNHDGVASFAHGDTAGLSHDGFAAYSHGDLAHGGITVASHSLAALGHSYTQPSDHIIDTHSTAGNVSPYYALAYIMRTA